MPNPTYTRRDDVLSAEVDGDTVLMSLQAGSYFGLSETGRRIWQLLEQPSTVDDLVTRIAAEFEVDEATCRADVEAFLAALEGASLASSGR